MKKLISAFAVCIAAVFFISTTSSTLDAKGPPEGKGSSQKVQKQGHDKDQTNKPQTKKDKTGKETGTPYGWSQGKKTGWAGGKYPPGWSKWDNNKRDGWVRDHDTSVTYINNELTRYRFSSAQQNQIISAFDEAVVGGMAINDAQRRLVEGVKDSTTRRSLLIDTAQTALEILR